MIRLFFAAVTALFNSLGWGTETLAALTELTAVAAREILLPLLEAIL
jgi:hypothetical protein